MKQHVTSGIISQIAPHSDAIAINGNARWLSTSGTPGVERNGRVSPLSPIRRQCAWNNILETIEVAGMSIENIIRISHFLVRREDLIPYRAICEKVLGEHRPASTLLFAAGLPWPEMLVEIQIDAAKLV